MSTSLVQRSLRLLKEDHTGKVSGKKSRISRKNRNQKRYGKFLDCKTKNTIFEIHATVAANHNICEDNIRTLQILSSKNIDSETAYKVFERNVKNNNTEAVVPIQPENTVFEEEDFLKFEQEYFCS